MFLQRDGRLPERIKYSNEYLTITVDQSSVRPVIPVNAFEWRAG
jgi:hypothetical protein